MFSVAVDIGGTFTDVVCRDPDGGVRYFKIPTTRNDESLAVLQAVEQMQVQWNIEPSAISRFAHGTTVATNAVLERRGAKIGLIATRGFGDVIEIGRQMRHQMYDVVLKPETPVFLAPGAWRREVAERIDARGEVLVQLDEAALLNAAAQLVAMGAEAIAVCFLFSFANPSHERRARELIEALHPEIAVATSHEVDPAFREYERTVVTAFDAYVKPVINRYLGRLERGLEQAGIGAGLQVMQSRGGLMASSIARQRPVRLFLSGPAAGVIGARITASAAGIRDVITVDIGGTSSDIALISDGKALIRADGLVDGYPIRVPMVDVNSIGAGGGSIAWIDRAGGLRVGPQSAGSEPGPACYGRGGKLPTVTDASIVLGYLNPEYFAGGTMTLDASLARQAILMHVADPLGISMQDAALGIHRVVNAQMAEGIRLVSIRQGLDPRRFTLLPLGGGGAVHASALANELSIARVLIPRYPGVLSAAGLLAAPVEHEVSAAFNQPLAGTRVEVLRRTLATLDERVDALMQQEALGKAEIRRNYFADLCYVGQAYTIEVPLELTGATALDRLYDIFLELHARIYGHSTVASVRIVNLRSVHQAGGSATLDNGRSTSESRPGSKGDLQSGLNGDTDRSLKGSRDVLVAGNKTWVAARVFDRNTLATGHSFAGPAIVEQADTTTLVEPGWQARIDSMGNLILDRIIAAANGV